MFGSSQAFGYSDATQETLKRAKTEEKQTCTPVTVRILEDAVARHAESQEVLVHGTEIAFVHLVGVVESLVEQSTMIEFQLNDASGRMKVRYYSSGEKPVKGLATGKYVSIVGNLRTAPTAHISAMNIRMVEAADEVSYHMIEVAHACLRLRNPSKVAPAPAAAVVSDPITPAKHSGGFGMGLSSINLGTDSTFSPPKQDAPVLQPMSVQTPPKTDLRGAVVDILNQVKDIGSDEGISSSSLLARLPSVFSADKVNEVLVQLVHDGDVFNTIDEKHFAIL